MVGAGCWWTCWAETISMHVDGGHMDHGACHNHLRSAHLRWVNTRHCRHWRGEHDSVEWEKGGNFCLGSDVGSHWHLVGRGCSGDNAGSRFREWMMRTNSLWTDYSHLLSSSLFLSLREYVFQVWAGCLQTQFEYKSLHLHTMGCDCGRGHFAAHGKWIIFQPDS